MTAAVSTESETTPSVLACLRALHPARRLTVTEALRVAELQAQRLLAFAGITDAPVSTQIIADLPRIHVEYDLQMPGVASGASDWDSRAGRWVISLNPTEPDTRIRLTTCHEFKHILDHGKPPIHPGYTRRSGARPAAEYVADYFAGCLLMPKQLLTRAWYQGIQRLGDLAALFDVSAAAMTVRLHQLGLVETPPRCRPADTTGQHPQQPSSHRYQRALAPTTSFQPAEVTA